jgi:hypothetical protein
MLVFNNMSLPQGVNLAPTGEFFILEGMFNLITEHSIVFRRMVEDGTMYKLLK